MDNDKGVINSDNGAVNMGGNGFAGLLTIVFIVLKLTGVINWSWWWILSPLWIGFIISAIVITIFAIVWHD
jgi:hypothetical protein